MTQSAPQAIHPVHPMHGARANARPAVLSVVDDHARAAAHLFRLRDEASTGPRHALWDLARLDTRLAKHLHGIEVAGASGWKVCAETLPLDAPAHVFVVSALALAVGAHRELAGVLDVAGLDEPCARAIVSAIGWTDIERARLPLEALLSPDGPAALQRMGIAAAVLHGFEPGPTLGYALSSPDAALRAAAWRAVGELGRVDLLRLVGGDAQPDDPSVTLWSAWSRALLGDAAGVSRLEAIAAASGEGAEVATDLASRAGGVPRVRAFIEYLDGRGAARLAIVAASALADASSVARLLAALGVPALARLAAEGLGAIVGVDTRAAPFVGAAPKGFEPEGPDPDEALSWPAIPAFEAACAKLALAPGARHLAGEQVSDAAAKRVLRTGTQRRRLSAALELALLHPGFPLVQVRGPAFRDPAFGQATTVATRRRD